MDTMLEGFVKALSRLGIKGLTLRTASAIVEEFSTPRGLALADSHKVEAALTGTGISGVDAAMVDRVKGAALDFNGTLGGAKYDADADMPGATPPAPAAAAPTTAPAAPTDPTSGLGTLLSSVLGYGHLTVEAIIPLFAASPNDVQIQAALREKAQGATIYVRQEGAGKQALLDVPKTLEAVKKWRRGGAVTQISGSLVLTLDEFLQERVKLCPITREEISGGITDLTGLDYSKYGDEDMTILALGVVTGSVRNGGEAANQILVSTFVGNGTYRRLKAQLQEWGDDDPRVLQAKGMLIGTVSPQATGGSPNPLAAFTQRGAAGTPAEPAAWNRGNRVV